MSVQTYEGEIPISAIVISERQRKEVGTKDFEQHITDLAESIKKFGLLHPINLDRANNGLLAGFCRLMAYAKLGRASIPFRYADTLTDIERKELELEENVRRKNLEWWEEAAAVAEIHEMKKAADPNWTMMKTAQLLGKSKGSAVEAITVGQALKERPELRDEKGATSAVRKLQTEKKIEEKIKEIAVIKKARGSSISAEVLLGDAFDLIRKEPDASYDCVATNFPFGVDLELKNEGGENLEVYEDDEEVITDLVMNMIPEIFRVLKDDSWFIGLFDINKITYNPFLAALAKQLGGQLPPNMRRGMGLKFWCEEAGFSYVSKIPFIWAKPNKTQGIIGNPQKGMIVSYEAGIFAAKGDAVLLKQGRQNLFLFDSPPHAERVHPLQMPTSLCLELLNMVVLGGGRVLDPFAGSAAFGVAAVEKQCEFRGFELDPSLAAKGQMRLDIATMKEE